MTSSSFVGLSRPLSLGVIYDRIAPTNSAAVALFLSIFVVSYALDEAIGLAFGLDQFVVASFAAGTVVAIAILGTVRDLFIRRWSLFYLRSDEFILGERNGAPVVVSTTEEIRAGALKGCRSLVLVNTQPWRNHRIECLTGALQTSFAVSLDVQPADPYKVRRWVDADAGDLVREFRSVASVVANRLGAGVLRESPERFEVALKHEFNSRILPPLGATCEISALRVIDPMKIGETGW